MAGTSAAAERVKLMAPAADNAKLNVMIAMNQTNSSGEAFDWIERIIINSAESPASFKLFLIHVQVHKPSIRNRIPCLRSPDEWSADSKRQGEDFLMGFETRCTGNRIESVRMLKRGCPEKEICEAVKEVKPDLLVLGNSGLGAFGRLFVTSVSGYCAKYAECPVIRIKHSAAMQPNPDNPVVPNPDNPGEL